ncbi:hypothetical protein R1flu_018557 [Riccia fluitans]|uniref:Uncharacterized protein n=1 Tax=Riccia fluitans TaxID=41844 RepID=A0ABD1ZG68_9MARC
MLTYKGLSRDCKYLLLLTGNCEGPSTPCHIVQMLYAYGSARQQEGKHEPEPLYIGMIKLENSGTMLRVIKESSRWSVQSGHTVHELSAPYQYETLALHDLQKEFLTVLMEADNERLERSLLDACDSLRIYQELWTDDS